MKVVMFGATGMVGQGALRECLLANDVEQVLSVGRRPTGVRHPKLIEREPADLTDLGPIEGDLAGADACFYCLGISSLGVDEASYTRICHDYPLAAARALSKINPDLTFVYVSGAGTNVHSRQMWARVKGRTEEEIIALLPHGYAFRPGFIQPMYGATSRTGWYRAAYTVTAPLIPLLTRMVPGHVTTTDRLGQAMLRAARTGFPSHIVEGRDLRDGM
jgi:uncharacterized protein YbjT (DUF2867 family)